MSDITVNSIWQGVWKHSPLLIALVSAIFAGLAWYSSEKAVSISQREIDFRIENSNYAIDFTTAGDLRMTASLRAYPIQSVEIIPVFGGVENGQFDQVFGTPILLNLGAPDEEDGVKLVYNIANVRDEICRLEDNQSMCTEHDDIFKVKVHYTVRGTMRTGYGKNS